MSGARWERLQELFHRALPLDPVARAALLDRGCAGDPDLRGEVERLLGANERAGRFIDTPAVASPPGTEADEAAMAGRRVGAWRLVRPVGRGGMGLVFLGERDDGAFAQQVAVKLIKRGMDTDQVLARFRAERQILASLDHPNIARLLDGGTTDDGLPYFAMEYIEGQPIDAWAHDRQLGVEERLRLFLQVCDAVAYAHAQGVIHRDIKPLNTLVTPAGVPKLLDFGIAKVLSDSSEVTSTVTGLRLLTPEYASPEQIEGRHVTTASDVYSLGVVLYELLTGRSPYRLTSRAPQDIAAAVCTTEPARPSAIVTRPGDARVRRAGVPAGTTGSGLATGRQLRRRLRGDLDTIVLTALRKEPARRYGSAAALAEDIRRHLDGRPVLARPDRLGYRAGKFVRRHRAVLFAAGLAVISAGLVAVAALVLLTRDAAGRGESASLIRTRALALRDRILVADFADRSGDSALAAAITEAFRIDLSQSPLVRVMTPRQVRASLELMQQSPDIALSDSLARELAVREGVKAFVTGSLVRLSGAYTINVQLVSAREGEALTAVRETAADSLQLIAAVDRASKTLRQRIGESLRDLENAPSLYQATTASLPALRLYSEGQRLVRRGERSEAIARFEQAVGLDTGFASAYVGLSMVYGSLADDGRAFAASEHAVANQTRLPFVERSFLIASRAYAREDYATTIRVYQDVVSRYPDNLPALNNLALAYRDGRQLAPAESLFRQAMAVDPTIANFYFGLHSVQALGGKFTQARATLDTIARRFPDNPVRLTEEMQDAAAQQDWDRAERTARAVIAKAGTDTAQLVDPWEALAGIAMTRGRLREAARRWRTQLAVSKASGTMGRHLFGAIQLANLERRYRRDTARALAILDSVFRAHPLDSLLPGDRRYDELVRFYVAAGRLPRARQLLTAAIGNDSLTLTPESERRWSRGLLAAAEGRREEALRELGRAAETIYCVICALPDLGRAYEAADRTADALAVYERYVTTPWLWRYEPDAVELSWTLRRLAELSERSGNRDRAARAREQLATLWREADPEVRTRMP